jgi:hypothetical protein
MEHQGAGSAALAGTGDQGLPVLTSTLSDKRIVPPYMTDPAGALANRTPEEFRAHHIAIAANARNGHQPRTLLLIGWKSGLRSVTLQVRNRNSGRLSSTVLVGASYQGERYIVSMLGDGSEWVQNARAAGGMAFISEGVHARQAN